MYDEARSPSLEGEDLKVPKQLIFVYEISQGNKGDTDFKAAFMLSPYQEKDKVEVDYKPYGN